MVENEDNVEPEELMVTRLGLGRVGEYVELQSLCQGYEGFHKQTAIYLSRNKLLFGYCLVALIDEKIVGGIHGCYKRDGDLFISCLMIHPRHRRKGIAKQLLKRCLFDNEDRTIFTDAYTDDTKQFIIKMIEEFGFEKINEIKNCYEDGKTLAIYMKTK